ncbi:uncharacterized protein BDV14DRAFT_195691 [Aspergillus stella-maris]|uniref:uncharacterized protein n=1 Tax=Aspergillus stella-maris TaxID=1810926 RepID=UPI003CCD7CD0
MRRNPTTKKLTSQGQRALIRNYNIQFEGPTRPHQWPKTYTSIFGLVRDAEKIRFDEYYQAQAGLEVEEDNSRTLHVWRMHSRVDNLVNQAYRLRESQDNEETWRMKTEHLILERFEADLECHVCSKCRWRSYLQALPSCSLAAEKLQERRSARSLCRCDEIVRAKLLPEPSSQRFFTTKVNCTVVDRTMQEIRDRKLARHKPDRVIGVRRAGKLDDLLSENPDTPATVVKGDIDMCFPFLVLEAKSEKNSVGFGSIERQTAFPIRTMLNVQRGLEVASLTSLTPLVWFLANQGDEWRVYGCVPDRARIVSLPFKFVGTKLKVKQRVIDLWHGCILRHDSALQLLLIMDMICDWARDIYAEQVVLSLRQQAELALITPAQHTAKRPRVFDTHANKVTKGRRITIQRQGSPEDVSKEARRRGTY